MNTTPHLSKLITRGMGNGQLVVTKGLSNTLEIILDEVKLRWNSFEFRNNKINFDTFIYHPKFEIKITKDS
ncbi:MAG: hypothetical protein WC476_01080 [Phycisphaerae bacterium]|jgi:hypothetical protein